MRINTIAIVLSHPDNSGDVPSVVTTLSDEREIESVEAAVRSGSADPLEEIRERREREQKEEDEFGDYVEGLLSKPFLHPDVREHGVQWLKSKIRIEQFQKTEAEAAKVIAEYALGLFLKDPDQVDFVLAGPSAQVRVRIIQLNRSNQALAA
jgi:hypothetical protein